MKYIILIIVSIGFVNTINSQSIRFNRYYENSPGKIQSEFESILPKENGYIAFNTLYKTIVFLDNEGNIRREKDYRDTSYMHHYQSGLGGSLFRKNSSGYSATDSYFQSVGESFFSYDSIWYAAMCLTKFNSSLDTLWTKRILFTNGDESNYTFPGALYDCIYDSNDKIYATGSGKMFLNGTVFNEKYSVILFKADLLGNPIWIKNFHYISSTEESFGKRILETNDNNLVIGATINYSYNYYLNSTSILLLKINKDGGLIWQRQLGHPLYHDELGDLIKIDSGFIATGNSYVNIPQNSNVFQSRGYMAKISMDGEIIWEKYLGKSEEGAFLANSLSHVDGNLYSIMSINDPDLYNRQIYLMKSTKNGDIVWKRPLYLDIYYEPYNDYRMKPLDLKSTSDGGFITSGTVSGDDFGSGVPFLIKTDKNGCDGLFSCQDTMTTVYLQSWEDSICNGDSVLVSIAIANGHAPYKGIINGTDTINEPLYIMADSSSYLFYAHPTINNSFVHITLEDQFGYQYSDFLQFNVVDCNISIDEIMPEVTFMVYPNPTISEINLMVYKGKYLNKKIEIYNQQGILIYCKSEFNTDNCIDISSFKNGVYTIKLITDKGIGIERFVKL